MSTCFGRSVFFILIRKSISILNGCNDSLDIMVLCDTSFDATLFKVLVHVYREFKSDCFLVYVDGQIEDIVRAAKRACHRSVPLAAAA